ncbi:unnamed protein product, partial [Meganyctiphanes norvegica]
MESEIRTKKKSKSNEESNTMKSVKLENQYHNLKHSIFQDNITQESTVPDVSYVDNTEDSYMTEEIGKHLDYYQEKLEEDTNYLKDPPPKKCHQSIQQGIQCPKKIIDHTGNQHPEPELLVDNASNRISLDDHSSLPLFCDDSYKVLQWFKEKNLIKSELKCDSCCHLMRWTKNAKTKDGYDWKCRNNDCMRYKSGKSIRQGSFFAKSRISLPKWFDIMYLWSKHVGAKSTSEQVSITCATIVDCYSFFREVCEVYFKTNPIQLGGPGIIIEIDVFCLSEKSKHKLPDVWVLCIVDNNCSPSVGYMEIVEPKDFTDHFPIIHKVVRPGSIMHTEVWRAYRKIQGLSETVEIVNDLVNFLDVKTRLHKKNIESYWNNHKSCFKAMGGCRRNFLNSYLQEYMWRERFSDNTLESLCQQIFVQHSDVAYIDKTVNFGLGKEIEKNQICLDGKLEENTIFLKEPPPQNCLGEELEQITNSVNNEEKEKANNSEEPPPKKCRVGFEQENLEPEPQGNNTLDDPSSIPLFCDNFSIVLRWFQQNKLIKSELRCESCCCFMNWSKNASAKDGYDWRCRNNKCIKFKHGKSLRLGSFFAKSRISLPKWFDIMYLWSNRVGAKATSNQVGIGCTAIVDCYSDFREVCVVYFKINPIKLGGPGITIEVDVFCLSYKSKCDYGCEIWVLCIVGSNCSSSVGYMETVETRDVATLFPIIFKVVRPGSIIHSKEWREYHKIQGLSDTGETLDDSINFVDHDISLCTKRIDLYWKKRKSYLTLIKGNQRNSLNPHFQEFMWRERFSDNAFECLCQHISFQYSNASFMDNPNSFCIDEEVQ